MNIIVKNIDDMDKPLSSGSLYFESNGIHGHISLSTGYAVFINHAEDRLILDEMNFHEKFPKGIPVDKVIINIDGWFHVFHELVISTPLSNVTKIEVIPHQEDLE